MREILFRGKRKDNGEWVEGQLIQSPYMGEVRSWISTPEDKTRLRAIATYYGDWRAVEVYTDTICQYTGLTDKNGNKIWENDIVKHYNNPNEPTQFVIGAIYWNEDNVRYERSSQYEHAKFSVLYDCVYEVIGNAFDHTDLLKGE